MGDVPAKPFQRARERRRFRLAMEGAPGPTSLMSAWAWVWRIDEVEPSFELLRQVREPYEEFRVGYQAAQGHGELEEHAYRLLQRFRGLAGETGDEKYHAAWSDVLAGRDPDRVEPAEKAPPRLTLNGQNLGRAGLF